MSDIDGGILRNPVADIAALYFDNNEFRRRHLFHELPDGSVVRVTIDRRTADEVKALDLLLATTATSKAGE